MANHLFLASTPFNMLTSAMVAFTLPEGDKAYLGLIDQPKVERVFVTALREWAGSPFEKSIALSQQAKGKAKRQLRQIAFTNIAEVIDKIKPNKIYTGNDRRIEFQFAMQYARKLTPSCTGVYIDDGTYSYLGRKTHWLKDKVADNLIKKLTYGAWWQQPQTVGASSWISEAILAFPSSAVKELQSKKCFSLPENLNRNEFKQLANACLAMLNYKAEKLAQINALVLFPHESVASERAKTKLGYWLKNQNAKISFKHHPRTQFTNTLDSKDAWLIPERATEVPAGIPIEVLLPLIQPTCQLAGDVSTALLTAKWLRPELEVTAFVTSETPTQWLELLELLDINIEEI